MAKLVNVKTNKLEPVADAEVSAKLASLDYKIPGHLVSERGVELVRPDGQIVDVPLDQLHEALGKKNNYTFESDLSREAAELEREYTGFLPGLAAKGAGFAQGFTGVATPVLEMLGVDVEAYETFNPIGYTVAEIAGTGTALYGTGGTSKLVGKGLGHFLGKVAKGGLVKGAAELAETAGKKATARMAEKTFGQKLLKKATAATVEGTLDAGMYGASRSVHELSLERAELTGENVAAVLTENLVVTPLVGGAFAGTITALGFPVVQAMKAASKPIKNMIASAIPLPMPKSYNTTEEFLTGVAEEAGYKALGPMLNSHRAVSRREAANPGWHGRAKKWLNEATTDVEGVETPVFAGGDTWEEIAPKLEAEKERIGDAVKGFYGEIDKLSEPGMGVSSANIVEGLNKLKAELPDATSRAARKELDDAILDAKKIGLKEDIRRHKELGGKMMQKRMTEYQRWRGEEFKDFIKNKHPMGQEGRGARVLDDILLDVEELDAEQLEELWDASNKVGRGRIKSKKGPIDWEGRSEFLPMNLPNTIETKNTYWKNRKFDQVRPRDVSMMNGDIARVWRDEADDAAERIIKLAEDLGGETKTSMQQFKRLKDEFGYAETFHSIVEDRALRADVNRAFSPTDHLLMMSGALGGTLSGGLGAGAVGGMIGAAGNRFLRERGLSYTAAGARSLAKLAKVQDGTVDAIIKRTREIARGTAAKTSSMAIPLSMKGLTQITFTGKTPQGDTEEEVMQDLIGQINSVSSDPVKFASQMSSDLRELEIFAPEIAAHAATTKAKMVEFLVEKAPKEEAPYNKLQPSVYDKAHLPPEAMAQFKRYLKAAVDPINSLLNEMAIGAVSYETTEALKRIYPKLLDQIQVKYGEELAGSDKIKSNTELASMMKVFDQPVVPYQEMGFSRRQQAMYKVASEGSMGGVPKSSAAQGTTAMNTQTAVNAVQSNLKRG